MRRLFYKPENAWVGDLIPYYENGTYYGFYLHDPRIRDKEYAEETTWHLIETKDFVNLDYKGESIARGGIHDANKNAYTGSVIKCEKDGLYHVFYTAYNEDFKLRGKTIQSVMQATGKNLENLKSNQGMKFDAHVSNVGFILYLVARLFQSLRKQIRVLSHVFYFTFRIRT